MTCVLIGVLFVFYCFYLHCCWVEHLQFCCTPLCNDNKVYFTLFYSVLKKGNLDPSENYGPISKMHFISKIMRKVIAEQLTAFIDKNSIWDTFQSGFQTMYSTETVLFKVATDIVMAAVSGHFSFTGTYCCIWYCGPHVSNSRAATTIYVALKSLSLKGI